MIRNIKPLKHEWLPTTEGKTPPRLFTITDGTVSFAYEKQSIMQHMGMCSMAWLPFTAVTVGHYGGSAYLLLRFRLLRREFPVSAEHEATWKLKNDIL